MILENSAIEEVFLKNSEIIEKIKIDKEYEKLLVRADKLAKKIETFLNEEQCEIFNEFINVNLGLEASGVDRYFTEGIRLGIRLAAECFLC